LDRLLDFQTQGFVDGNVYRELKPEISAELRNIDNNHDPDTDPDPDSDDAGTRPDPDRGNDG